MMDPNKLSDGSRKLSLSHSKGAEKCIHGNEKGLGCCGYDELAVKPATTTPFSFGVRQKAKAKPQDVEMGERPRIQAKPLPQSDIQVPVNQGIPLQPGIGGRIPDGNAGVGGKVRSVFDANPKANRANNQGSTIPERPRVVAVALGQETKADPVPQAPPPNQVEAILKREAAPEGITKVESEDLALALAPAIENSALALAEGDSCFGVDGDVLKKAAGIRDGLLKFTNTAPDDARLEINTEEISLIEQVLECGVLYETRKKADSSKTMAFVAGGLVVGAVILILVSS